MSLNIPLLTLSIEALMDREDRQKLSEAVETKEIQMCKVNVWRVLSQVIYNL